MISKRKEYMNESEENDEFMWNLIIGRIIDMIQAAVI